MTLPSARQQWLPILLEGSRTGGFVSHDRQEAFGRKVLSNFPPGSYSSSDLARYGRDSSERGTLELRYVEIQQKAIRQMTNEAPPLVLTRGNHGSWSLTREGSDYLQEWLSGQLPTDILVEQAVASEKRLWQLVPNWVDNLERDARGEAKAIDAVAKAVEAVRKLARRSGPSASREAPRPSVIQAGSHRYPERVEVIAEMIRELGGRATVSELFERLSTDAAGLFAKPRRIAASIRWDMRRESPKFDRDGTAIKLVGNEVLNRAKKLLLHIQKQAEHDRQQRPSPVPAHSVLTDSLGLGAVAWPILKGQQRKKALSIGDQVTLQEATDYLRGAPGNHNLISSFGTDDRKQNLQKAIESFRTAADQWAAGHLRDPKLNWLVPEPLIDGRNRFYEGWLEHVSDPWRSRLEGCQRANRWLPLLSVEAVNVLKKMSAADYAFISTVLGRASLLIGDEGALKPWRGTFRPELGKLPVGYLYQVDATNKLDRILSRLTYAGCQNIGHLVILDQEAWQLSRDVSLSEWGKLKLVLDELG